MENSKSWRVLELKFTSFIEEWAGLAAGCKEIKDELHAKIHQKVETVAMQVDFELDWFSTTLCTRVKEGLAYKSSYATFF